MVSVRLFTKKSTLSIPLSLQKKKKEEDMISLFIDLKKLQ